jgi:tetratricopeptide (TPR) repeat protein
MDANEALDFTNDLLQQKGQKRLNSIESTIFREVWGNPDKQYRQIADETNYAEGTINTIANSIWKRLTEPFGEKVTKNRLRETVESYIRKKSGILEKKEDSILGVCIPSLENSSFISPPTSESKVIDFKSSERRNKYQQALECIKDAGSVEDWDDLKLLLKACNIYQQLGDIEQAANLVVKSIDTPWHRQDPVGAIACRLGLLTETSSVVGWLIEKVETGWHLPTTVISKLYNIGGNLIWMSSNDTLQSISFHQKSQEYASRKNHRQLIVVSEVNQALCNIDHGEIEEARKNISRGYEFNHSVAESCDSDDYQKLEIALDCLFAYIEILMNKNQASELAEKVYSTLSDNKKFELINNWERNNLPVYAAKALQNIGSYEKSFEMYMKADSFAKASGCIQVEAQVLTGKALLYYLDGKKFPVEKSITWLLEAKQKFEMIKAEGDQAYASLLLGVMFKELGKTQESQRYFKEAEEFYKTRNARQRIIRLNQIRELNRLFRV